MNEKLKKAGTVFFYMMMLGCGFYLWWHYGQWMSLLTGRNCMACTGLLILLLSGLLIHYSESNLVAENRIMTCITGFTAFIGIYSVMGWLVLDLCGLFIDIDPVLCGTLVILMTLLMALWGMFQASKVSTVHYTVKGFGFHKRVVLLSDLHIGYYVGTRHIRKVVDAVDPLDADLIVIAGDMINDGNTLECPEIKETEVLLSSLKSARGTYACTGNHDPLPSDPDFITFLNRSGIHLLQNEAVMVDDLQIVGRNTEIYPRPSLDEIEMQKKKTLLIDHDPCGIKEAVDHGIDLVVCGHTHKGQVFPFQLFTRLIYSKSENYGYGVHDHTTSIVSSGAGVFSMPMRLGSRCEVAVIDLQ